MMKQVHISYKVAAVQNHHRRRYEVSDKDILSETVTIKWKDGVDSPHTCGWLLSEFIRRTEKPEGYFTTIAIRSKNSQHITLDCYLTHVERSISILEQDQELEAVQIPTCELTKIQQTSQDESLDHYLIEKVIGKGGFSKVLLVRHKATGQLYAMKVMRKDRIKKDNKVMQIMTERRILEQLQREQHPFIVKMHSAFQSKHYLHFVLEFCAGGELFFIITKHRKFTESIARFYFCEILLGIEQLHQSNIMYRDLKPENILIDLDGHVRITDFGLSKDNFKKRDRAQSFCGSPEYMSPDMLSKEYHTRMVDYYSLGALLFELLTGLPPFYSHNRDEMYHNIVNKELTVFPPHLSKEAVQVLKGLLNKSPEHRLGFHKGIEEVKAMDFFKGVNWTQLKQKKIKPPNKMNPVFDQASIKTEFFDPEYIQMSPRLSLLGDIDNNCENEVQDQLNQSALKRSKSQKIMRSSTNQSLDSINLQQPLPAAGVAPEILIVPDSPSNLEYKDNINFNMFHTVKLEDLKHHLNYKGGAPQLGSKERKLQIDLDSEKISPTFKNFKYSMLKKLVITPKIKVQQSQASTSTQMQQYRHNRQQLAGLLQSKENQEEDSVHHHSLESSTGGGVGVVNHFTDHNDDILLMSPLNVVGQLNSHTQRLTYTENAQTSIQQNQYIPHNTQQVGILQESGKPLFPGEKLITDESPDCFDHHSHASSSQSIQEFRVNEEHEVFQTDSQLPSQRQYLEIQHQQHSLAEDNSEIVLDVRDEAYLVGDTMGNESSAQQSIIILPPPQKQQDTNYIQIHRELTQRCLTPKRNQERLVNDQIENLYEHFVFKGAKIFDRKMAIVKNQDPIVSPDFTVTPRAVLTRPSNNILDLKIDNNILQKNLLLKRKYGEVVGNVIQERKRKVSTNRIIGEKQQSHTNVGAETDREYDNKSSPSSHFKMTGSSKIQSKVSPANSLFKKAQTFINATSLIQPMKSPRDMMTSKILKKSHLEIETNKKVYAEYFMQQKESPNRDQSAKSRKIFAKTSQKPMQKKKTAAGQNATLFSPLKNQTDSSSDLNNPYCQQNSKQEYNQKQYSELRKKGYLNTTSEGGRQSYRQNNTSRSGSKFGSGSGIEFYRSFENHQNTHAQHLKTDRSQNSNYAARSLIGGTSHQDILLKTNIKLQPKKQQLMSPNNKLLFFKGSEDAKKNKNNQSQLKNTAKIQSQKSTTSIVETQNSMYGQESLRIARNFTAHHGNGYIQADSYQHQQTEPLQPASPILKHEVQTIYHNMPVLPLNLLPASTSNTQFLLESPRVQHLHTDFIPRILDQPHDLEEILDPYNVNEDDEDILSKKQESEGLFSRESGDINQNIIVRNNEEEEELKIVDSESQKSKNNTNSQPKNRYGGVGVKRTQDGNSTVTSKKDDPEHIQRLINERMREIQQKINKPQLAQTKGTSHYKKPILPNFSTMSANTSGPTSSYSRIPKYPVHNKKPAIGNKTTSNFMKPQIINQSVVDLNSHSSSFGLQQPPTVQQQQSSNFQILNDLLHQHNNSAKSQQMIVMNSGQSRGSLNTQSRSIVQDLKPQNKNNAGGSFIGSTTIKSMNTGASTTSNKFITPNRHLLANNNKGSMIFSSSGSGLNKQPFSKYQ